jgi:hypothetical protein
MRTALAIANTLAVAIALVAPAQAQVSFKVGDAQHSPAADSLGEARDAVTREISRDKPSSLSSPDTPRPVRAQAPAPGPDQFALQKLRKEYGEAIQLKIESNWLPPFRPKPGSVCNLLIRQLQGGEIVMAETVQPCGYDVATKASLEKAVIDAGPLPYRGYEPVFVRQMIFVFKTPTKLVRVGQGAPPRPAAADTSGADYAKALQKHLMNFWQKPSSPPPPGQSCTASFDQLPGGQVIKTSFDTRCFTDSSGRVTASVDTWKKSIETAAKAASPLPYQGFERVFKRTVKLTFRTQ